MGSEFWEGFTDGPWVVTCTGTIGSSRNEQTEKCTSAQQASKRLQELSRQQQSLGFGTQEDHNQQKFVQKVDLVKKALALASKSPSISHAILYHLLLQELDLNLLDARLDPPEPHLGIALDQCSGFANWVGQLDCAPDAPSEMKALAGRPPPSGDLDKMLLLVAGSRNHAAVNHLSPDKWASGRKARIAILLHLGADIDTRHSLNGTTVLHHLAALNDCVSIEFSISQGADSNARDNDQKTPLFWAGKMMGRGASLRKLVESGADVLATDTMHRTALHEVAFDGDTEMVNILVLLGADPNSSDGQVTPLHCAARLGRIEIVKALIESGADPSIKGESRTSLQEAEENDNHEVVAYLRSQLGEAPAFTMENELESLERLAEKLGGQAARSALDSGDYGYFEEHDDLNPDDLPLDFWNSNYRANIEDAIRVMSEEAPTQLLMEESLIDTLFQVYLESWKSVA